MLRITMLVLGLVIAAGCSTVKPEKATATNVKLASLISSNMVLQRGVATNIWGTADPGGVVFVKINKQEKWADVDSDGNWTVALNGMKAGGPYEMIIEGQEPIKLENVMVGDVWICSGQSNMQWTVANSKDPKKEIAAAKHPNIRLFTVPRVVSDKPLDAVKGTWMVCSPKTIPSFSAVGYYFGRKLEKDLRVPIGLIHTSWGGTPAEAWTTKESLEKDPELSPIVTRFEKIVENYPATLAKHKERVKKWKENLKKKNLKTRHDDPGNSGYAKGYASLNFNDSKWKTMELPQLWENIMKIDGVVWFRKKVTIPEKYAGKDLVLQLPAIDDFDVTYFNNSEVGRMGKETPDSWRTPREYKIPANLVKAGKAVIAVRVFDHFGGGGFGSGEMTLGTKNDSSPIKLAGKWKYLVANKMDPGALYSARGPRRPIGPGHSHSPAGLYNAMIHPLIKYPVKGAIWYQGESNAGRAYQYRTLLKTMIKDWRRVWKQNHMPFFIVQLANFRTPATKPGPSSWAELREAQAMALELPKTGLAVAIDIGEAKDIHPKNKQDVGKRLALAAERIAYGKNIVHSGPTFESMKIDGSKVIIKFRNVGSGLVAKGGALKHFAIAGKDQKFVWAAAYTAGNTVVVSSPAVKNPVAVRYAWADNPEGCNLYNREGLPAVPFRTDQWKGMTAGRR